MMTKKKEWYAVKKGRKTGLYNKWAECEAQVVGYPGAIFKGFYTKEEAEAYLLGKKVVSLFVDEDLPQKEKTQIHVSRKKEEPLPDPERMTIYVDGSYMSLYPDAFSFGVVFLYQGQIHTYSKKIVNKEDAEMHNVAGEIYGATYAMNECIKKGIREMDLYYDYAGIEKWCLGKWKVNKPRTKAFRDYYASIKNELIVHFHKVESHTGVKYNEMADQLAKKALLDEE